MRVAELRKIWDKRYTALCRERKIRTIGGYGYLATDTYISSNALTVNQKGDDVHLSWWCEIKPLAIDPILWTIFMPETDLGSERRRLSLRVNGAFTATGLKIDRETTVVLPTADPDFHITRYLDRFAAAHTDFTAHYPTIDDFLSQLRTRTETPKLNPSRKSLREALTLIAAGRVDEAAHLVDTAIAAGDKGHMHGPQGGIYPLIADYCRRPRTADSPSGD